jgi:glycosyltransferase involved in cell wall biosynthesis
MDAVPPTAPPVPPDGNGRPSGVVILNWRDTDNPEGGGSELFVERMAAGLAALGRPVTLVCAAHGGAPPEERRRGIRVLRRGSGLTVHLRALLLHASGRLGPHGVIVDVQNGLPFLSALWCRRPVVVLVHHVHREQWPVVLPAPLASLGWWIESRLAPQVYRRASYVAVSHSTRRELIELGVRPEAISVIHNGASPLPPDPAARSASPTICVLGRLVPHKRVELALEAAARLRPRIPDLRLLVVGRGWWEPQLRETAARLGLAGAVRFTGFVDEATKRELLASSWVLAMPSLKEGWGLAVIEAAEHGVPAVGFRSAGGLAESIVHGVTGLLADGPEEFAAHLERVLTDRALRERLGEAARARCARFGWDRAAASFGAVLDAAEAGSARSVDLQRLVGRGLAVGRRDQRQRRRERQQQGADGQGHEDPHGRGH